MSTKGDADDDKHEDKGGANDDDDDVTILNDGGHLMTKLFAGLDKQPNLFTQWPTHRWFSILNLCDGVPPWNFEYLCSIFFYSGFDPIDTRHRSKHYIHETHVYPPDRIISTFDDPAGITVSKSISPESNLLLLAP